MILFAVHFYFKIYLRIDYIKNFDFDILLGTYPELRVVLSVFGENRLDSEKPGLDRFCYFILLFFFSLIFKRDEKVGKK